MSAGVDHLVKVWEVGGGEGMETYGHSLPLTAVAVSPDGRLIASGSADDTIHLWEAATARDLFTLKGSAAAITILSFTPDSKYLVSTAGEDRALRVWDCATGREKATTKDAGPSGAMPVMAATPDGKQAVAWVAPDALEYYDLNTGKLANSAEVGDGLKKVTSLTFSTDGAVAALGSSDGKVRLWDVVKRRPAPPGGDLQVHEGKVVDLTLSADKKVVAAVDEEGLIEVWDAAKGKELQALKAFTEPDHRATAFVLSPDGSRLATAGEDGVVRLLSTSDGKELRSWNFAASAQPRQLVRAGAGLHAGRQTARHGQRRHDDVPAGLSVTKN